MPYARGMKKLLALAVVALALTGCAPNANTLGELGCETADSYLLELDAAAAGEIDDPDELKDLYARVEEELRLDYFDAEVHGLFRLLADPVADAVGESYTPIDTDYTDLRGRLISYCQGDVGWDMKNA
jgi:hypothetical protein